MPLIHPAVFQLAGDALPRRVIGGHAPVNEPDLVVAGLRCRALIAVAVLIGQNQRGAEGVPAVEIIAVGGVLPHGAGAGNLLRVHPPGQGQRQQGGALVELIGGAEVGGVMITDPDRAIHGPCSGAAPQLHPHGRIRARRNHPGSLIRAVSLEGHIERSAVGHQRGGVIGHGGRIAEHPAVLHVVLGRA